MTKLTSIALLALIALFQACSTPARTVAQEKQLDNFEEKKHHYPALRRLDRY